MDEPKGTKDLNSKELAAVEKMIEQVMKEQCPDKQLTEAARQSILARLQGLRAEFIRQFWNVFTHSNVEWFTVAEWPLITQVLDSLEKQQRGLSIFDIRHEDACALGEE